LSNIAKSVLSCFGAFLPQQNIIREWRKRDPIQNLQLKIPAACCRDLQLLTVDKDFFFEV